MGKSMGDRNYFRSFRKRSDVTKVMVTFVLTSAVVVPDLYPVYHLCSLVKLYNMLYTCIVKHMIVLFSFG